MEELLIFNEEEANVIAGPAEQLLIWMDGEIASAVPVGISALLEQAICADATIRDARFSALVAGGFYLKGKVSGFDGRVTVELPAAGTVDPSHFVRRATITGHGGLQ